jgi:hypothetical protein
MNRNQAIKAHCKECSGGTADEVTGCSLFDCPLWPFRIGSGVNTASYKKRIKWFFGKANNAIVQELTADGLTVKDYLK